MATKRDKTLKMIAETVDQLITLLRARTRPETRKVHSLHVLEEKCSKLQASILLVTSSSWPPAVIYTTTIRMLAEKYNVPVLIADVSQANDIVNHYNIATIPTLIVLSYCYPLTVLEGVKRVNEIRRIFKSLARSAKGEAGH